MTDELVISFFINVTFCSHQRPEMLDDMVLNIFWLKCNFFHNEYLEERTNQ